MADGDIAGGLSGNGAVIQSMISEMTDESNEARVFPLYSLTWALGSIVGCVSYSARSEYTLTSV